MTAGLLDDVFGPRIDPASRDALVESEGRYVRIDDAWWIPSGRVIPAAERFYQPVVAFDPFDFAYYAVGNRVRKVFVHAIGRDERIYLGRGIPQARLLCCHLRAPDPPRL